MSYTSGKIYGHEVGLSACFRQHSATSHCSYLHGYALSIELRFEADQLDSRNWIVDFGGLKRVKSMLRDTFDHKLLVAEDDPEKDRLCELAQFGLADVVIVEATGCEAFAKMVFHTVAGWLSGTPNFPRVKLVEVIVREHGANFASYKEAR